VGSHSGVLNRIKPLPPPTFFEVVLTRHRHVPTLSISSSIAPPSTVYIQLVPFRCFSEPPVWCGPRNSLGDIGTRTWHITPRTRGAGVASAVLEGDMSREL